MEKGDSLKEAIRDVVKEVLEEEMKRISQEDMKEIVHELIPEIDKVVAERIKSHIKELAIHLQNKFD